jgi:hypothetical protein
VEAMLNEDDVGEQDEFQPDAMEVDDETTLEAEERLGREMSHDQEMSLLQQEGEIVACHVCSSGKRFGRRNVA